MGVQIRELINGETAMLGTVQLINTHVHNKKVIKRIMMKLEKKHRGCWRGSRACIRQRKGTDALVQPILYADFLLRNDRTLVTFSNIALQDTSTAPVMAPDAHVIKRVQGTPKYDGG